MRYLFLLTSTLFVMAWQAVQAESSAVYEVTFIGNWTEDRHPFDYPSGTAHFSPPVVVAHGAEYSLFELGTMATPGLEEVAETGKTMTIEQELAEVQLLGVLSDHAVGSGIPSPTGMASVRVVVTKDKPFVSAVTMLAPSPDWIAGVNAVEVYEKGGFVKSKTVLTYAVDAGTDSGETYTSANEDTQPQGSIQVLMSDHFLSDGELVPVGRVEIKRVD